MRTVLDFANGTFNAEIGDIVYCSGKSSYMCSKDVTLELAVAWRIVEIQGRNIIATPVDKVNGTILSLLHHCGPGLKGPYYYIFPANIMNWISRGGENPRPRGAYCSYCGASTEDYSIIDDRIICNECKPSHTFVCIECGEVHDTRRRMRGLDLCRPCSDENNDKYIRAHDNGRVYLKSDLIEVDGKWCTPEFVEQATFDCPICNKKHFITGAVTVGKKRMCRSCADEYYPICDSCNRRHVKRNCTVVRSGNIVCARCLANKYKRCSICGEWESVFQLIIPEDSTDYYCRTCCTSLHKCSHCGRYYVDASSIKEIRVEGSYRSTHNICSHCESIYIKCEDCDTYHPRISARLAPDGKWYCEDHIGDHFIQCSNCYGWYPVDAVTHGSDDYMMCDECFSNAAHGTSGCLDGSRDSYTAPEGVTYYSYKPTPVLYPNKDTNGMYLGIELECDGGHNSYSVANKVNKMLGFTYAKHDGSLGEEGIEFVSHPATIDYFMDHKDDFAKAMKYLRRKGYSSHNSGTCGLHVHVSAFPLIYETDNGIEKLLYLQNKFWDNLYKFSRREESALNCWARRIPVDSVVNDNSLEPDERAKYLKDAKNSSKVCNRARYQCINLQNGSTVEFRMMRGTLNIDTFMATLQLIHNICDLALIKTLDEVTALSWNDIVYRNGYVELKEYWASRALPLSDMEKYDQDSDFPARRVVANENEIYVAGSTISFAA